MVPGLIAGHYSRRDAHIDLERLAHAAGARFVQDMRSSSSRKQSVTCAQGTEVIYDVLSLDVGSVANTAPIGGAERCGLPVKPVDRLLAGVEALLEEARRAALDHRRCRCGRRRHRALLCARLSPAPRGRHAARALCHRDASSEILPGYSDAVRRRVLRTLEQREIAVHTDRRVAGADERGIVLDGGERIAADRVVWVTGPAAGPVAARQRPRARRAGLRAGRRPSAVDLPRTRLRGRRRSHHEVASAPEVRRLCRASGAAARAQSALRCAGRCHAGPSTRNVARCNSSPPASAMPSRRGASSAAKAAGSGAGKTGSIAASSRATREDLPLY